MTTITLDFSAAYRAINDDDILPIMTRDPFGWDGKGEPVAAVHLETDRGVVTDHPAVNLTDGIPAFYVAHSPSDNQFDLINFLNKTVLRFVLPVNQAPIWENYVQAAYIGDAESQQFFVDQSAYSTAYDNWVNYVMTNEFRASTAAYSDKGGTLGQFTATDALIVEDFTTAPQFFAVNIIGSGFSDNFSGGDLNDTLAGATGQDVIRGVGGDDLINGGFGDDTLYGQDGADHLSGSNDADHVYGGLGNDTESGDAGDDTVVGGAGNDVLSGVDGNDSISGGAGADRLFGGNESDLLYGGDGDDFLVGGAQDDTLNGGNGADTLTGGTDDDALSGGVGKDILSGGDGRDFLRGGLDNDTLTGGAGHDVFNFNFLGTANADRITDFVHGTDRIGLDRATFAAVHAALDAGEFRLGAAAQDGDDRIIYDQASGRLFYDPDGTLHGAQSAAPVLFAIVANHAALTFQDFVMD